MPKVYGFTEYGDSTTQEFWDQPKPEPGPSELLVAVKAAGVNPIDWKIREGYLQESMPLDLPAVLGREVSGVVAEVGHDVDGFAVGDEIVGRTAPGSGGYAEFTLVTASTAAKKPTAMAFTDAAALPVAVTTAYLGVRQLGLESGQSLLINGIGGGVGVAAAQFARNVGVNVLGTGSESKRDLVESLGATLVVSGEGVAGRVRELLPDGVDAVLDAVGGEPLRDVVSLVRARGKILSTADAQTATEFGGSQVAPDETGEALVHVVRLVADGKVDPHVSDVLPLDEAAAALNDVESGHSRGKTVLQIS